MVRGDCVHRCRPAPRGFTLLELLVVVGITAVLLGIALPVLRNVRLTVRERAVLAHQRQSGLELLTYLNNHNGAFPYAGTPGTMRVTYPIVDGPGKGDTSETDSFYWRHMHVWAYLCVLDGYTMDGPFTGPDTPVGPARIPGSVMCIDWMTSAAFAKPAYFAPGGVQEVAGLGRQRIQITAHPSKKGILQRYNYLVFHEMTDKERDAKFDSIPAFVWFADGHAAMHAPGDMRTPNVGLPNHMPAPGEPVLATADGLLGRDL